MSPLPASVAAAGAVGGPDGGAAAPAGASSASGLRTSPSEVKCRRSVTLKGFLSSLILLGLAARPLVRASPGRPSRITGERRPAPDRRQVPDVTTAQRLRAPQ